MLSSTDKTHTCTLVGNKWLNASTLQGVPRMYFTKLVSAKGCRKSKRKYSEAAVPYCFCRKGAECDEDVWKMCTGSLSLLHLAQFGTKWCVIGNLLSKIPPLSLTPNPMHVHSGWHLQRQVDGGCVSLSNYYISYVLLFCGVVAQSNELKFALTFKSRHQDQSFLPEDAQVVFFLS